MSEETTSTATETTAAETTAAETETTLVTGAAETTEASTEGSETEAATTTTEATEETAETQEAETTEETKVEGAPEEYADFTMPEGVELDAELAGEFKGVAKELNLTQEQAQKVAELGAKMRQRDAEAIVALREDWVTQTKSDPEIGGDKLDATLATAKKAVSAYGSQQFIDLLNQTGFGNHPEFVRFCAKAGLAVSEDSKVVTNSNPNATGHQTLAGRLFSSSKE